MIGWWLSLVLATLLQCRPLAYFWDKTIDNGYCINENSFAYGITAANVITDIVVLVLPIPWLWRLQLAPRKKLAVIGIFVLGSL